MATAMKSKRPAEQGGQFRILIGDHIGKGPDGCECDDCLRTNGTDHRYTARRYSNTGDALDPENYDNDLIDSPVDLVARHNKGPNSRKFERVQTPRVREKAAGSPPDLEAMTNRQLQDYARETGVDLAGAKSREDIIRVLRSV